MSEKIQVPIGKGNFKEVDATLFAGYKNEAVAVLDKVAEAQEEYKALVDTVAETTGLKKGLVGKYFKAAFAAKTEEAKQLAQAFEALDTAGE
jgi:hypothetical protein